MKLVGKIPGHRNRAQRGFLITLAAFLAVMFALAAYRSYSRRSVLSGAGPQNSSQTTLGSIGLSDGGSAVRLQEFHRVEVKNGKPSWEIVAKEARYFPDKGFTIVSDSTLVIYGQNGSATRIRSKSAKVFLEGSALKRADLEGSVVLNMDDAVFTEAEFATYDSVGSEFIVPGDARIRGAGFEITGTGLNADMERRILLIKNNVNSTFEPWAKAPENLAGSLSGPAGGGKAKPAVTAASANSAQEE